MPFDLYTDVILTADLPNQGLRAGDVGTVVERHKVPNIEDGYSVEFFDMTGQTVAVATIIGTLLRSPTPSDLPSVRVVSKP